ncbi:tetratricopeptide repeat protein [bacterium]|nr:tetratricopeptide repeat protein [bacterium]
MWQKIIKFSVYSLVFLMPLFWLPFSFEAFEFNKGYLLFVLVSIGMLAWLGKMIFQDKEIRFRRTPLDLYVLGFLVIMIFSTLFSQDRISSLLGFYGRFWPSLVGILSLGGFYFLLTNNIIAKRSPAASTPRGNISVAGLIKLFLWSSFFVVLITYFSLFGFWTRIENVVPGNFQFPQVMELRTFNPIGGSLEQLSVFLAVVVVLLIGILAFKPLIKSARQLQFEEREKEKEGKKEKRKEKGAGTGLYILLFLSLGVLIIIDFWASWLVIFGALLSFLTLAFWKRIFKEDVNRLGFSVFLLLIALVFLLFDPVQNFLPQDSALGNLPSEVLLNQKTSWTIGWQGFKEHPVFGSGLGNFNYSFSKFKPESFVRGPFWQIRFDRAGNHITEMLSTNGILGVLSYFLLIGMFLLISLIIVGIRNQGSDRNQESGIKNKQNIIIHNSLFIIPLFLGFIALLIAQFVYYQNTVLAFSFWLFLGLTVLSWQKPLREKVYSFKEFPEVGLIFSTIFWVILIGFLTLYFYGAKFYLADIHYRNYLLAPSQNIEELEKATKLADSRTVYHIVLARNYLQRFASETAKPQPNNQIIANMVALAVQQGKKAVELSPNRVASQETLGVIYRDIQGVAQGALSWGVKSFENALALEPKNPVLLTELGKLQVSNNKFSEARDLFNRALAIKPFFVDAVIQLSILDERENKSREAITRLEDLVQNNPFSVEAHFQLGRLYYNNKDYDKAITQFQSALLIFPSHSNSHYSLGLTYEKKGEKEKALREFEKVLELNPGNEDVMRKIEELKE